MLGGVSSCCEQGLPFMAVSGLRSAGSARRLRSGLRDRDGTASFTIEGRDASAKVSVQS